MTGFSGRGRGFTLVELQIALILFLMILGVLYGGLHIAQVSQGAVSRSAERQLDHRLMDDVLRRQLAGVVPARLARHEDVKLLFDASGDTLRYLTPLPIHAGSGGLYWSGPEVIRGDKVSQLVLTYCPVDWDRLDRRGCASEPDHSLLLSGVTEVRFEYYGRVSEGTPEQWLEKWESATQLPLLVRASINFVDQAEPTIWTYRVLTQIDPGQTQFLYRPLPGGDSR